MGRDELLRQKREKEAALKDINRQYKDPVSVKYEMVGESGKKEYAEYFPESDMLFLSWGATIAGEYLKAVRDILDKVLEE